MKKAIIFSIVLFSIVLSLYGQHTVNDIKSHDGWYKIAVETGSDGNSRYSITQCYPNGDEYSLDDNDRKQLPVWVKIICIAMHEEVLKGQAKSMVFHEGGIYMKILGFILMIDSSKSDEEVLESLEQETVDKYKNRNW